MNIELYGVWNFVEGRWYNDVFKSEHQAKNNICHLEQISESDFDRTYEVIQGYFYALENPKSYNTDEHMLSEDDVLLDDEDLDLLMRGLFK